MSTIDYAQFCSKLAEVLEVGADKVTGQPFAHIAEYDSMGKINASLLVEELFGFQIAFETLDTATSAATLFAYCTDHATAVPS
jgi:acyl carrier protein